MNQMNQRPDETKLEARYRVQLILWLSILSAVGAFLLLTKVVETPNTVNDNMMLVWILLAFGLSTLALSFVLKGKLLANAINKQRPELVQSALIVAWALCEATALLGLVVFFVTGSSAYYIFFIFSALGILLHFPRREHLRAAAFKGGGQGFTIQ